MNSILQTQRITQNLQLQQDLERCHQIYIGACRIVTIAHNPLQRLDAAKTAFVSNLQLINYLKLIQQERNESAKLSMGQPNTLIVPSTNRNTDCVNGPSQVPSRLGLARLCLSDIRIPLLWRSYTIGMNMQFSMDQLLSSLNSTSTLTNSTLPKLGGFGDIGDKSSTVDAVTESYSLFCVIRVGNIIRDTRLIFDIRPGTSDIVFDEKWTFEDVDPNFKCVIEIYAFPKTGFRGNTAFNWRKPTINPDFGKKLLDQFDMNASGQFDQGLSISSFFELVGQCVANLTHVHSRIKAHTLQMNSHQSTVLDQSPNQSNGHLSTHLKRLSIRENFHMNRLNSMSESTQQSNCDFPLFGNICYRLLAQPYSVKEPLKKGFLWIRKLTPFPTQNAAILYRCELRDQSIRAYLVNKVPTSLNISVPLRKLNLESNKETNSNKLSTCVPIIYEPSDFIKSLKEDISHTISTLTENQSQSNDDSTYVNTHTNVSSSTDSPDLIIPVKTMTQFLDPEPLLRKLELMHLPKSNLVLEGLTSNVELNAVLDSNSQEPMSLSNSQSDDNTGSQDIPVTDQSQTPPFIKQAISNPDLTWIIDEPDLIEPTAIKRLLYRSPQNFNRTKSNSVGHLSTVHKLSLSRRTDENMSWTLTNSAKVKPESIVKMKTKRHFKKLNKKSNRLSVSLGLLPFSVLNPDSYLQPSRKTSSLLDCSNLDCAVQTQPDSPQLEKSSHDFILQTKLYESQSYVRREVELFTFRFTVTVFPEDKTLIEEPKSEQSATIAKMPKSPEVYELAVSQPSEFDDFEIANLEANFEETNAWFGLMKKHIIEQETWGSQAFSGTLDVPQVVSTVRDTSARRSVAIF